MLMRIVVIAVVLAGRGQSAAQTVSRAFCGKDGKAHVEHAGKPAKIIAAEHEQVGCAYMEIADDHRTIGWAVEVESCCTSYPIAASLVVLRDGKKTVIHSAQMIWEWRFVEHGARVAMLSGPVHGRAAAANLCDARTGKTLEEWDGSGEAPAWAGEWKDEFAGE